MLSAALGGPWAFRAAAVVALACVGAATVRAAWLSDDAYITARTLDNFAHGYGLRWNVAERVQVYTHPLWMLLLMALSSLTHEFFYSATWLGVVTSLLALGVAGLGARRSPGRALFCAALLVMSKTFLSYATSGLENPLLFLLLAAFLSLYLGGGGAPARDPQRRLFFLALLSALGALTRIDSLLLFLPPLGEAAFRAVGGLALVRVLAVLLRGFVPLLAWEAFALFYYGSLVPNTAYAKLNTGIPADLLVKQGLRYVNNLLLWDPLSAVVILLGLVIAAANPGGPRQAGRRRIDLRPRAVGLGLLLYLVYTVVIGGDFMSGRFFSAPLFCAVVLLYRTHLEGLPGRLSFALLALPLLGLWSAAPGSHWDWLLGRSRELYQDRIADERIHYYPATGLFADRPPPRLNYLPSFGIGLREKGLKSVIEPCIGMVGYYAGPSVHIIDSYALADPFLSRLPAMNPRDFRIGHFEREVPEGYQDTIDSGSNRIRDPGLAALYARVALLTRAPLLDPRRWHAVVSMNLGR